MINVAVVIPFFQVKPGILRRAIGSILRQRLSPEIKVNIFVVDDGSPVSAVEELEDFAVNAPFNLTLLHQENHGVANARNRALRQLSISTDYVAFLDSDDVWYDQHLQRGIGALESGHDFYFSNHSRKGFHDSHFVDHCSKILNFPKIPWFEYNLLEIPLEELTALLIETCPIQISTFIFRHRVAPDILFLEKLNVAGEDVIFFIEVAARSQNLCANTDIMVQCGRGVNIYFGRISWIGDNRVRILHDRILSYSYIAERMTLSTANLALTRQLMSALKRDFVFFSCRYIVTERRWPPELSSIATRKLSFAIWFAATALDVATKWTMGLYRPGPG